MNDMGPRIEPWGTQYSQIYRIINLHFLSPIKKIRPYPVANLLRYNFPICVIVLNGQRNGEQWKHPYERLWHFKKNYIAKSLERYFLGNAIGYLVQVSLRKIEDLQKQITSLVL